MTADMLRRVRTHRLYTQLAKAGRRLTREQYSICKGWIRAGQFDTAERFLQKHGRQNP